MTRGTIGIALVLESIDNSGARLSDLDHGPPLQEDAISPSVVPPREAELPPTDPMITRLRFNDENKEPSRSEHKVDATPRLDRILGLDQKVGNRDATCSSVHDFFS
jgi:hypothetical protein